MGFLGFVKGFTFMGTLWMFYASVGGLKNFLRALQWWLLPCCFKFFSQKDSLQNHPLMLSFQATISEIQRLSSVVPLGLTHRTLSATIVDGFRFPEGSVFVANLTCIMQHQDNFPHPDIFNPQRFIGGSGE